MKCAAFITPVVGNKCFVRREITNCNMSVYNTSVSISYLLSIGMIIVLSHSSFYPIVVWEGTLQKKTVFINDTHRQITFYLAQLSNFY